MVIAEPRPLLAAAMGCDCATRARKRIGGGSKLFSHRVGSEPSLYGSDNHPSSHCIGIHYAYIDFEDDEDDDMYFINVWVNPAANSSS